MSKVGDLEWGIVEVLGGPLPPRIQSIIVGKIKREIDGVTVNGVPLADVLERAARRVSSMAHPPAFYSGDYVAETTETAAVLRALAGRDSDE
jgi:hypothetical protein